MSRQMWRGQLLTPSVVSASPVDSFRAVIVPSQAHIREIWAAGAFGCSTRSTRFKPAFMEKKRKRFVDDDDDIMPETMQLNPIEAMFLVDSGKLEVEFNGTVLDVNQARQEFLRRYSTDTLGFNVRFDAYKTFRTSGWIPKTGTQYGSNLVLYATDPDYCHSKFCVTLRSPNSTPLAAYEMMRIMRVSEQTRKRAVLCDEKLNCIQLRRWVLKQDRAHAQRKPEEKGAKRQKT